MPSGRRSEHNLTYIIQYFPEKINNRKKYYNSAANNVLILYVLILYRKKLELALRNFGIFHKKNLKIWKKKKILTIIS